MAKKRVKVRRHPRQLHGWKALPDDKNCWVRREDFIKITFDENADPKGWGIQLGRVTPRGTYQVQEWEEASSYDEALKAARVYLKSF